MLGSFPAVILNAVSSLSHYLSFCSDHTIETGEQFCIWVCFSFTVVIRTTLENFSKNSPVSRKSRFEIFRFFVLFRANKASDQAYNSLIVAKLCLKILNLNNVN